MARPGNFFGNFKDFALAFSGISYCLITQMAAILAELERIAAGDSVPDELLSTIDLIAITMQGLKGEDAND